MKYSIFITTQHKIFDDLLWDSKKTLLKGKLNWFPLMALKLFSTSEVHEVCYLKLDKNLDLKSHSSNHRFQDDLTVPLQLYL